MAFGPGTDGSLSRRGSFKLRGLEWIASIREALDGPGGRRFRGGAWSLVASLWVVTMLAPTPCPAVAQNRDATPSAEELSREYRLESTPEAGARPTSAQVSGTPTVGPRRPPPTADDDGAPGVLLLIAAGLAAVSAMIAALAWIGWRARRTGAMPPLPTRRRSAPGTSAAARSSRRRPLAPAAASEQSRNNGERTTPVPGRVSGARRTGGRQPGADPAARSAAPPDAALEWAAEIEWHHEPGGASRFCIVASRGGARERTAVSESEPLGWPPTGPESVNALKHAVEQLESGAVAAGWRPAPSGGAWYAKRFIWQPARVPPLTLRR